MTKIAPSKKVALIKGITGHDGAYLGEAAHHQCSVTRVHLRDALCMGWEPAPSHPCA